jgi:hypothetical protein
VQSPALAIAYSIWIRNRKGYRLSAATLAATAALYPALFAYSSAWGTLVASMIPLVGVFAYVLNSTIFAQEPGNLSSSYPRHMLVLPVKIRTMVFWPILYGSLLTVCLWIFTATVIYRSSGLTIPLMMPALVLVVVVTWFQALAWIPFSVRWLRDLIGITLTLALGALPVWILSRDPAAGTLVSALLLVYLAAGYALAVAALKADRRGDVWFLRSGPGRAGAGATRAARLRIAHPFRSAAMAQLWYEWSCHGLGMVVFFLGLFILIWGKLVSTGKPI